MKYFILTALLVATGICLQAQNKYPDIEFSNEVYYLKKDSVHTVIRLEKDHSKMETKTKMGGMAGAENGYTMDGEHSGIRLRNGDNLSFVYSTGSTTPKPSSSSSSDSMMRANGMDPAMMQNFSMGGNDPANMITLYKVETGKGKRKVLLMKSPGAMPFGSKKIKSSDKYTFSVKKIRDGYWELVIDKSLPKGEYAFTMMDQPGTGSMDMGVLIFAFGIED